MLGSKEEPKKDEKSLSAQELENVLKAYDNIAGAYKSQWELSIYALEPQFHYDIEKIKEELAMRKNYTDKDHPHNP